MENKKFTIKSSVAIFFKKSNSKNQSRVTLSCLFQGSRIVKSYEIDNTSLRCIKMFNGTYSLRSIAYQNNLAINDLIALVKFLEQEGVIVLNYKKDINNKYIRQLNFFDNYETPLIKAIDFHNRLEASKVLIIGLGSIGSWVLENLVRMGIRNFIVIDPDKISRNNLPRQTLYDEKDIGKAKTDKAIKKCLLINPDLIIKGYKFYITRVSQLAKLTKNTSLIINCADQPDISIVNNIVSKVGHRYSIPHILCGGYDGHISFIGQTVIPGKTSCWQCYIDNEKHNKELNQYKYLPITNSQKEGGTLASIASITASIHSLEAIKTITGYTKPAMANYRAEIDFNTLKITRIKIPKRPSCLRCGEIEKR